MYGLMVAFELTRVTMVSRGHNEDMNIGNVAVKSRTMGDRDHSGSGGTRRKL